MAKFCGNCGAWMDDSARVCGQCGTPFESTGYSGFYNPGNDLGYTPGYGNGGMHGNPVKYADPVKKEKTKKIIILSVCLVVVLAIALSALSIVLQFTGYNGFLRKVMNAYEIDDIDALCDMASDVYYYGDADWAENEFGYAVAQDLDYLESVVGPNYKFSYEVTETYELAGRNLNRELEEIERWTDDFDSDTIDEIVVADLIVTAKKGKRKESIGVSIVMSKEDGSWRLLDIR